MKHLRENSNYYLLEIDDTYRIVRNDYDDEIMVECTNLQQALNCWNNYYNCDSQDTWFNYAING